MQKQKSQRTSLLTLALRLQLLIAGGSTALLLLLPGPSLLDRLRWFDSGICAHIPTHMLQVGNQLLPLCARTTGIYLGAITTLLTLFAMKRGRAQQLPRWQLSIVLICGVVALAIDGSNSFAGDLGLPHLYQPHNLLRLATGFLTGIALVTLTLPNINRLLWCEYNDQRSISTRRELLWLLTIGILCFLAIASQSPLMLYPLALLSTIGLLSVVSIVNLLLLVAIGKRDQTFESYRQLLPFFVGACLLALGELSVLAQLKFLILHALGIS